MKLRTAPTAVFAALLMIGTTCSSCTTSPGPPPAEAKSTAETKSTTPPGYVDIDCSDPKFKDPNSKDPLAEQCARQKSITSKGAQVHYTKKFDLSGLPDFVPDGDISGTIRQAGQNYLADSPVMKRWEDAFQKFHPGVTFQDNMKSTLLGIPSLYLGQADMAALGRPIVFDELNGYQRAFNSAPLEIVNATGSLDVDGWNAALGVYVNDKNPIKQLNFDQLDGIFGAERTGGFNGLKWDPSAARGPEKNIRTWGQLGLTGEWADKPIHVYGYVNEFKFPDWFSKTVLHGSSKRNEQMTEFTNQTNPDGTLKLVNDQIMDTLANDPYGITYITVDNKQKRPDTKVLPLSEKPEGPYVAPTLETVQNRTYPFAENTYYYLIKEPGKPLDPKAKEFMRFILSRQGQEIIMNDGKYLPLTPELAKAQLDKLNQP